MWRWLRIKRMLIATGKTLVSIDLGLYIVGFLFFAFFFAIAQIIIGLFTGTF